MTRSTTTLLATLTLATGFAVTTAGYAVTQPVPTPSSVESEAETEVLAGQIISLDLDNNKFTIRTTGEANANKEIEITVTDDTEYMLDNEVSERDKVLVKNKRVMVWHKDGEATRVARNESQ